MELTEKFLLELQNRLKVGSRRGVHLNAIPGRSRYKFDLTRLSHIDKNLPQNFVDALLTQLPLKFKISWKDNVPDLNSLFEDDQVQLVKITKSFENLINQTDAIESEKGINTFGFGFPILIRRDQTDNKLTVAPVLIWSLRIKRTKDFNTWEVQRNEDDPIYINEVLINHLQNDSKIEINQISEEHLEDGIIDKNELIDICFNLIDSINTSTPSDLKSTFERKLNQITPIGDKKHYESLPLTSNNSFIDFGGIFSIFEVQKQNIINDYNELLELAGDTIDLEDIDEYYFQPISSVETDPSQQGILHSLNHSRNILIQGPPGTGKSQSLTAILVNALENKKKTIVVCEKRTALEVLSNSLNERGLNFQTILIKDIVKDRRLAVDSVRDRIDNSAYRKYRYTHSKETLDNIIKKSKSLIDAINKRHQKLDEKLLGNSNWTNIVGAFLSQLKGFSEDYKLNLNSELFQFETDELNRWLELIRQGQTLYQEYQPYNELSFLNSEKLVGENPFVVERRIKEDFKKYEDFLTKIIDNWNKLRLEYFEIRRKEYAQQKRVIDKYLKSLGNILREYQGSPDFFDERKTSGVFYKISAIFSKNKKELISAQLAFEKNYSELVSISETFDDFQNVGACNSIAEKKKKLDDYSTKIGSEELQFQNKIENEYSELNFFSNLIDKYATASYHKLKQTLNDLKSKLIADEWVKDEIPEKHQEFLTSINNLIAIKNHYFEYNEDLFSKEFKWFQYYNSISSDERMVINQLLQQDDWRKIFLINYFDLLLISNANMDLPTDDNDHIELNHSLKNLKTEQIRYITEYWYSQQIDATREFDRRNPSLSVENLYNKRASSKYRRLSLREIVKFDIDLFTTFFPVILTTPDVASNLFKGKNKYFHIVMFDEASQLKLEDNLPALLKGKQIIIAGDEHQMPPSNYFSKIFDGTIEDEDDFEDEIEKIKSNASNSLLDCESLLDFASELGFDKRHLDFHYRSRHPYLIDYSNFAFYNQRLKPLPNGFDYNPIKFVQVNGTYSDNSNDAEAEMVLSIIENNISKMPNGKYPSVGVATFNINQRNLILSKINERRKFDSFKDFNDKIQEFEDNGFFVKNLENIQGDERDVIILSTTYGINKDGKFAQRFGSINHSKGYKLLNVIITRAKYKIYVCSSIPQEVFLNYKEHLITEGSNNRRAVFYAYLAYAKAVSEQDEEGRLAILNNLAENSTKTTSIDSFNADLESPFEEEVFEALKEHFDESKITPQLKFAGFRIDLVYNSNKPGIPPIAIECDGADYHSSQEAYLYDRHRQKILEGHGFVFHRIWSTNWWRNSKAETRKLVEFIKGVESQIHLQIEDRSSTSQAFTDNIVRVEDKIGNSSPVFANDSKEKVNSFGELDLIFHENDKPKIELNSKVKIKYINLDKDLKVQLVDQIILNPFKNDGVQKINIKSPLAIALKGRSVGDTVKIGNLDNYVKILEILN
ncbi:DUF4011 domain-containing protein [Paucihalobacter ruber]|uniref:DUF4011 domain-containing protein n=1 Tax=Paucihalobacter ruber TaxID=2567861 RepID=A0A506PIM1_9FLAO|nr:AAA domain-containing protein [Paucihalobacter ruber]TPV33225.1 DUF4011 domain-containing protein [Paucihalobacter ruber]